MIEIYKPTAARRKSPNTVTLDTSPYRDHFEFIADTVVAKHESRPQFLKTLATMIDEYQPATFVESTVVASLAVYRWRQFRFCGMFAAASASDDVSDRTALLAVLARQERHCKRLYNYTRKLLLKMLSTRVNNFADRTPPPPAAASPKKSRAAHSAATAVGKFRVLPKGKLPIAA
ncbi:MAG TPA: hypothetical protein VHZ74_16715 [Bryobacteraceae bacterium]|jgi:hypothetical protein|nr:hypothetical protein [Bryobacteraceae bacterium]